MKELKCPKCGNAFTVDEADYAFILQQVVARKEDEIVQLKAEIDGKEKAIAEIDKSIKALEATKQALLSSGDHLRLANDKAEDLTIRKLTRGNPTMKAMFAAVADKSADGQNGEETA